MKRVKTGEDHQVLRHFHHHQENQKGSTYYAQVRAYLSFNKVYNGSYSKVTSLQLPNLYASWFLPGHGEHNKDRTTNLRLASKAIDNRDPAGTDLFP